MDAELRQATAAPGVLWGEFDAATQAHGLATTGGQVSHTGFAGLTLGGGIGYLIGKHRSVCDNLISVDIVTAGGHDPALAGADRVLTGVRAELAGRTDHDSRISELT